MISGYIYQTSTSSIPQGEEFFAKFNAFNLLRFMMVFCAGAYYAACEPLSERSRILFWAVPAVLITFGPTSASTKAGVLLLLALLAIEIGRTPLLFSRFYCRVGDMSYGRFLYAYPVQNSITTYFFNGHNFAVVTAASFGMTLICAIISWQLIEKPALRLKKNIAPLSGSHVVKPDAMQRHST